MERSERVRGCVKRVPAPHPARSSQGEGKERAIDADDRMTRIQLILIRLLLLALFLGAWEVLPRNGVINPLLLPPFGDVITTLVQILGRPQVHEAILITSAEVIVAFVIAVPLG